MKTTTLIFLIVLLVIGGLYFLARNVEWTAAPSEPEAAAPETGTIFETVPGEAVEIRVAGEDGQTLAFERVGDDWYIVEPVRAPARPHAVADITDAMHFLRAERSYGPDDELAPGPELTGLDHPRWTITLRDAEDRTYTLRVGRPVPATTSRTYVQSGGSDRVHVVGVDFASTLSRPLPEYRSRDVLNVPADEIRRIAVTGRASFTLVRTDEDVWHLAAPVSAPADTDRAEKLARRLADLRVTRFVTDRPGDLGPYGLTEPLLTVTITARPDKPAAPAETQPNITGPATAPGEDVWRIAFGGRTADRVYARVVEPDRANVFQVDASVVDDLQPDPADLRERRVLEFDTPAVRRIEVDVPGGKAQLVRSEGEWLMSRPVAGPANERTVSELLAAMSGLRAERFRTDPLAEEVYGLAHPRGRITLELQGRDEPVALVVGGKSPSGEMVGVRRAGDEAVAVVAASAAETFLAAPANYWDAVLLRVPPERTITRLDLNRPDGEFSLVLGEDGHWRLTEPANAPAETEAVNKILDTVETVESSRVVWLGKELPPRYADATRQIAVTLTTRAHAAKEAATHPAAHPGTAPTTPASAPADSEETHRLVVAKIGAHSYVWRAGQTMTAVGEMGSRFYNTLDAELRNRRVLDFDPADVRGFRLACGPDEMTFQRRGEDEWVFTGDVDVSIDAKKVRAFLQDAAAFRAERFVTHTQGEDDAYGLSKPWLTLTIERFGQAPPTDAPPATAPAETRPAGDDDGAAAALRLLVSHQPTDEPHHRYATASGIDGVFYLSAETVQKLTRSLADFTQDQ